MRAAAVVTALATVTALAVFCFAGGDQEISITYGAGGRVITNTNDVDRIIFSPAATKVSIAVAATTNEILYVCPNVTTAEFATVTAATSAVPILGGYTYELPRDGFGSIHALCVQSASGSIKFTVEARK